MDGVIETYLKKRELLKSIKIEGIIGKYLKWRDLLKSSENVGNY